MRGINSGSIVLLWILVWNIFVYIAYKLRKYIKHKTGISGYSVLMVLVVNAILAAILCYNSIVIGVTGYCIKSDRIPEEFNNFKILQISDFHTGTFHGGTDRLVEKAKEAQPDIIALTGDLIDDEQVNLSVVKRLVEQLATIAPVYSVSGNHDIWYSDFEGYQRLLTKLGVTIMDNRGIILQRGNSSIKLYGIGDPKSWNDAAAEEFLQSEMRALKPGNGFNILLFHRANMFGLIKGKGFQLVLSGHMHGGQLQIPFIGGLVSPHHNSRWFPKYTDGKWVEEGTTMIVSKRSWEQCSHTKIFKPSRAGINNLGFGEIIHITYLLDYCT